MRTYHVEVRLSNIITYTNALLSPENIKGFHQHLRDAPNLENVMSTFQIM